MISIALSQIRLNYSESWLTSTTSFHSGTLSSYRVSLSSDLKSFLISVAAKCSMGYSALSFLPTFSSDESYLRSPKNITSTKSSTTKYHTTPRSLFPVKSRLLWCSRALRGIRYVLLPSAWRLMGLSFGPLREIFSSRHTDSLQISLPCGCGVSSPPLLWYSCSSSRFVQTLFRYPSSGACSHLQLRFRNSGDSRSKESSSF